jgi:peroxiredoxin
MAARKDNTMLTSGPAPEVEVFDLEGNRRGLPGSPPALLVFYKASCPTCQFTLPFLERIYQRKTQPVEIFLISQDDAETTREFLQEFKITIPALIDDDDANYPASNAYGLSHVPSLFLVNRERMIAGAGMGFDKKGLEGFGRLLGVEQVFRPDEYVPEFRSG